MEFNETFDSDYTYGVIGLHIRKPSNRWYRSGVREGDFLASTSITKAVNSGEKVHEALSAPVGTEIVVVRKVNGDYEKIFITLQE